MIKEKQSLSYMCPSSVNPCGLCSYAFVEYEIGLEEGESILVCASCFMGQCFQNIKKGGYPPGTTMDEFRQQIRLASITGFD